jgi:calcium-dependent protein kinase
MGEILGNGSYGQVFFAQNKSDKTHKVAVKVINKTNMDEDDLESLRTEVAILQKVDHPNVIKYFETYDDKSKIHLVMEYCTGGELLDTISSSNKNLEKTTANVMEKITRALIHIHSMNITHKDIKPDNIMFSAEGTVKLIDFGLSQITKYKDE